MGENVDGAEWLGPVASHEYLTLKKKKFHPNGQVENFFPLIFGVENTDAALVMWGDRVQRIGTGAIRYHGAPR